MSREVHVRFWESAGASFPRATRQSEIYARRGIDLGIGNSNALLLAPDPAGKRRWAGLMRPLESAATVGCDGLRVDDPAEKRRSWGSPTGEP
jgi:hypothetical protein